MAAFLILHGHKLDYFFSLSRTEKIFAHAAIEVEQDRKNDVIKTLVEAAMAGRRL